MRVGKTWAQKSNAQPKQNRQRPGLKRPLTELEIRLRHWGRVFGPPPPPEWDEEKSGTRGARLPILLGGKRQGIMTLPFGDEPLIHGMWVKTPLGDREFMPKRWTAKGRQTPNSGTRTWNPPPDADAVEQAMLELYRLNAVQACVLRAHYCLRLSKTWGTWKVCQWLDIRLSRANYYREFEIARAWMGGRLRLSDSMAEVSGRCKGEDR